MLASFLLTDKRKPKVKIQTKDIGRRKLERKGSRSMGPIGDGTISNGIVVKLHTSGGTGWGRGISRVVVNVREQPVSPVNLTRPGDDPNPCCSDSRLTVSSSEWDTGSGLMWERDSVLSLSHTHVKYRCLSVLLYFPFCRVLHRMSIRAFILYDIVETYEFFWKYYCFITFVRFIGNWLLINEYTIEIYYLIKRW